MSYPEWWAGDPEHAPALLAFELIRRSHHVRKNDDGHWIIDFETAWEEPLSSGERILVAHAWCLHNLGWAYEKELSESRTVGQDEPGRGPVYWSNPSRAVGTLGGKHLDLYMEMIDIRLGRK